MLSDQQAIEQTARLSDREYFNQRTPAAIKEIALALQAADSESIAAQVVDWWKTESTQCPQPGVLRARVHELNDRASGMQRPRCQVCGGSTWVSRSRIVRYKPGTFTVLAWRPADHLDPEELLDLRARLGADEELLSAARPCAACRPDGSPDKHVRVYV